MDELRIWAGPIAAVISIATAIYTFLTASSKRNAAELEKSTQKLIDHDRRIQEIETEMRHVPSKEDISELKLQLANLAGEVGRLAESNGGVSRAVRRIEEYLLKEKG
ncbi:DUF2730 family protein [Mesorhizobium xinjiangense]|uniref:DUF2730 family protein n=1 Tax=Mesorhizobium xinjiangense TaxID=2678685 RepID=UPI0018DCBFDD|nr:DUF2730 family protein [Mesorhizobium xinjiangense]